MSADNGEEDAMYLYGLLVVSELVESTDRKEGVAYLKNAADKGHVDSMNFYGKMLLDGDSVLCDKKAASVYLKNAADKGNVESMYHYGRMLFYGDGIIADKNEASVYLKKAAESGNSDAMSLYGKMLDTGDGVQMNKEEAKLYLKNSSNDQNEESEERDYIYRLMDIMKQETEVLFECQGIKYSSKKEGTNLKKFKLFRTRFAIFEFRNDKVVKSYNMGEFNMVEPLANFGDDTSTSLDILDKNESLRIKLQTKEMKEGLLNEFSKLAPSDLDSQIYAPVFVPSNLVPKCMLCGAKFSLLSTKNHCNFCGRCVCKKCSVYSMQLPGFGNDSKKVCNQCYSRILEAKQEHPVDNLFNIIKAIQLDKIKSIKL